MNGDALSTGIEEKTQEKTNNCHILRLFCEKKRTKSTKNSKNGNIFVFFVTAAQYNRYQERRKYEKASKDKVWTD